LRLRWRGGKKEKKKKKGNRHAGRLLSAPHFGFGRREERGKLGERERGVPKGIPPDGGLSSDMRWERKKKREFKGGRKKRGGK